MGHGAFPAAQHGRLPPWSVHRTAPHFCPVPPPPMITHVPQMIPQHCPFSALPRCSFVLSPQLLLLPGAVASVACHAGPTAPITCGCSDRALLAVNTNQPCSSSPTWCGQAALHGGELEPRIEHSTAGTSSPHPTVPSPSPRHSVRTSDTPLRCPKMKIVTQPQGGRSPVNTASLGAAGGQHTASRLLLDSYFISWFSRQETQRLVSAGGRGTGGPRVGGPRRAPWPLLPSWSGMLRKLTGGRGRWLPVGHLVERRSPAAPAGAGAGALRRCEAWTQAGAHIQPAARRLPFKPGRPLSLAAACRRWPANGTAVACP